MQAVSSVPQTDPRVLTSRGYEPDNIAPPAATVMNQQRISAAQAEQVRMAAIMDEARGLAARSGLNFDTMPQERQAEFINAVKFGMGGPTSGRF